MSGFKKKVVEIDVYYPVDNFSGGLLYYSDAGTAIAPLSVVGGSAPLILTNDKAGAFTNTAYAPVDVTNVWNEVTDEFDWTELSLGDMIDIRLDISITTVLVKTEVKVDLHVAIGGSEYVIPWVNPTNFKSIGTFKNVTYSGIYLDSANILNNKANFRVSADKDCTVVVNGWYVKIVRRG